MPHKGPTKRKRYTEIQRIQFNFLTLKGDSVYPVCVQGKKDKRSDFARNKKQENESKGSSASLD
jgi:hypothetical protein